MTNGNLFIEQERAGPGMKNSRGGLTRSRKRDPQTPDQSGQERRKNKLMVMWKKSTTSS